MKNISLKSLIIAFLVLFTFATISCKNEPEDPQPTEITTIVFSSPSAHSAITGAQVVNIAGQINAEKQIHGYKVIVRNKTNNTETVVKDAHDHTTQVNFAADWTNNVTGHCDMEAEVIVTLDHDGKTFSKKVAFHCMP